MLRYTPPIPNHSVTNWIIWGSITFLMLALLISSIVFFALRYKKKGKEFLTIKKITIFSTFLAFFLIQAFVFAPLLKLPIPFSFDSITTIAIGFIFGPLEGILFGWIADTLRVLINGWSYALLPSLMYPMIGLISGIAGTLYWEKETLPKWKSMLIFQVLIISLFVLILPLEYGLMSMSDKITDAKKTAIATLITSIATFLLLEMLFAYAIYYKWNSKEMMLLTLLLVVAYCDRLMELTIRPFTQYFAGYEKVYVIALYTRILSSTYLIPTVTLTSFVLIKTSNYVLELK